LEAAGFSEKLIHFCHTAPANIPEGCVLHSHLHEHLKPYTLIIGFSKKKKKKKKMLNEKRKYRIYLKYVSVSLFNKIRGK
jgi:hypothetical protein